MLIKLDLVVGEQKHTKRIYSEAEIQSAISKVKFPLLVDNSSAFTVNLEGICGHVDNIIIEDTDVMADFHLNEKTPFGIITKALLDEGVDLTFRICGTGMVNEDFTVTEYMITKIYLDMRMP